LEEGEFSTQRKRVGVPQGSDISPVLYSLCINDVSEAPGTHLSLLADDTFICVTEKQERRVLRKLQSGLNAVNAWYEHCSIKFNERNIQAIYFSRILRDPNDLLQLNGRNIPFVNNVTYLGVTFNRRMTRRHDIERSVAKALRAC
jgi:hypothetical protein